MRKLLFPLSGLVTGFVAVSAFRHGAPLWLVPLIVGAGFALAELVRRIVPHVQVRLSVYAEMSIFRFGHADAVNSACFLRRDPRLERLLAEVNAGAARWGFPPVKAQIRWRRGWLVSLSAAECVWVKGFPEHKRNLISIMGWHLNKASDEVLRVVIAHEVGHFHQNHRSPHPFFRRLKHLDEETVCNLFAAALYGPEVTDRVHREHQLHPHGAKGRNVELTRPVGYRLPGGH